jgi:hypothetical protein
VHALNCAHARCVAHQQLLTCVDAEDAALGLGVWQGELNLPVNTPGPDKSRVQCLNTIGGHNDLRSTARQSTQFSVSLSPQARAVVGHHILLLHLPTPATHDKWKNHDCMCPQASTTLS